MRKFTKCVLTLALLVLALGSAKATKLSLSFKTDYYCNATWTANTNTFSWGNKEGRESWMSDDWTFMAVDGLSGDLSSWTLLHMKLSDFTNASESKLTIYFKENKGNTQSMDYVAKAELVPDANGEVELDLTTFDWKNNANPSETIDKTNIADVTIYGGARVEESQTASVKVTDAYLWKPNAAPAEVAGTLIKEVDFSTMSSYGMWHSDFTDNAYSISISNGKMVVEKETAGDNWKAQYEVANGISTKKGANYLIRATLKGSTAGSLTCVLGDWGTSLNTALAFYDDEEVVDVTLKNFPATINGAAHVLFQSGAFAGTITISNVKVYELIAVDTYGDAIATKDFTKQSDQNIYWKNDNAPDPAYDTENGMSVTVTSAVNYWEYQYNVAQAATEKGKDYIIHATIKGTKAANLHWSFGSYPNTVSGAFAVTTDWQTIELMCANVPHTGTSDLAIQVGDYVATMYIKDVTIYPATEGRLISVGSAGYTTFSADVPVKMRDVIAYKAKFTNGKVKLTPVTEVPAGAGVIVEADADNYKVPVIESAEALTDNDLLVSDGTVTGDANTIYVLANGNNGVGFYKLASGETIPAGKAYLQIDASTARDFIGFGDGETTGIHSFDNGQLTIDNGVYNLNGQRVSQPTKGLYIVNGKKVVLK